MTSLHVRRTNVNVLDLNSPWARLRWLREYLGLTQKELADRVGVDPSAIAHYERPHGKVPGRAVQNAIAGELEVPRTFLWPPSDEQVAA